MLASLALDTNSHILMARFARAHFDYFPPIGPDKRRVRWSSARFARSAPDYKKIDDIVVFDLIGVQSTMDFGEWGGAAKFCDDLHFTRYSAHIYPQKPNRITYGMTLAAL